MIFQKNCVSDILSEAACKWEEFLGAFAKLRKEATTFVVYILLFVLMEQLGCHWTDFHKAYTLVFFEMLSRKVNFY